MDKNLAAVKKRLFIQGVWFYCIESYFLHLFACLCFFRLWDKDTTTSWMFFFVFFFFFAAWFPDPRHSLWNNQSKSSLWVRWVTSAHLRLCFFFVKWRDQCVRSALKQQRKYTVWSSTPRKHLLFYSKGASRLYTFSAFASANEADQ